MKLLTIFEPSEQVLIFENGIRIESYLRIWHNDRWYLRYAVCERRSQSQPAVFIVYRNEEHYQRRHHADIIVLNNYVGYEYGFKIKKSDRTLAIILKDFVLALSFRHIKNMVFWKEWLKDVCGRSVIFYMKTKGIPDNIKILLSSENVRLHLNRDAFLFVQDSPPRPLHYVTIKELLEVECVANTVTFKTRAIRIQKDQFFWLESDQVPELKDRLMRLLENKQFQKRKTENLVKPLATKTMSLPRNLNVEVVGLKKDRNYVNSFPKLHTVKHLDYENAEIIQYASKRKMNSDIQENRNDTKTTNVLSTSIPSFKLFVDTANESKQQLKNRRLVSSSAFQDARYQNWVKATQFVKALRKKSAKMLSKSTEMLSKQELDTHYTKTKKTLANSQENDTNNLIFPLLDRSPASFICPISNQQQHAPPGLIKVSANNRFNMNSFEGFMAKKLRTSIKGSYSRYDGERSTPDFQDEDVETSSKFSAIDCAIKRSQERMRQSDRRNSGFPVPVRPSSRTGTISSDASSTHANDFNTTPFSQSHSQNNTMPSMYAIEEKSSINSSVTLAKGSPSTVVNSTISVSGIDMAKSLQESELECVDFDRVIADSSSLSLPTQNFDLPSPSFSMESSISIQSEFGPNGISFSRNGSNRRSKQKQMERFFNQIVIPPELPPRKLTAPANSSYMHDAKDSKIKRQSKLKPSTLDYLQWSSIESDAYPNESTQSSPKKLVFESGDVNYVDISTQPFSNIQTQKVPSQADFLYSHVHMVKSNSMFTLDRRRSSRRSKDTEDTKSARHSPSFIKSVSNLLSRYRNSHNSSFSSPNSIRFAFN